MDLHAARLPKATQQKQRKLKPAGDVFARNTVLAQRFRNRENRTCSGARPERDLNFFGGFYAGDGATPEIYPPYKSGGAVAKKVRIEEVQTQDNILKEVHSRGARHVFAHRLGQVLRPAVKA